MLSELETKVSAMLDIRQGMTVHKDGSVSKKGASKPRVVKERVQVTETPETQATLSFAGATYSPAVSNQVGVLAFTSADDHAVSAVKSLESMGLAGRYQKAGNVEVCIQNSGPPDAPTSIFLKMPAGAKLADAAKSLASLGIEVT